MALDKLCITKIEINTKNGRINRRSITCHEQIDKTYCCCNCNDDQNEIYATRLSIEACEGYNIFIKEFPDSNITIGIKLTLFIKSHLKENNIISSISYLQVEIQYIQNDIQFTENCFINPLDNTPRCIYNILYQIRLSSKIQKTSLNLHYLDGNIVISNKAAAILVHEFAHLFEADIYLYSRKYINSISNDIELKDLYHHVALPNICCDIDDEFSLNRDVTIIENGIVKNIIVDKKWSQIFHTDLYGNGRHSFMDNSSIIFPRVRISYIKHNVTKPSNSITCEIDDFLKIDNIGKGKLIAKDGRVILEVQSAKYHHGGEITHITPFTIQGSIIDIINSIICTSDNKYYSAIPCGKNGQQLPCGVITPSDLLIKGGIYAL